MHDDETRVRCATARAGSLTVDGFRLDLRRELGRHVASSFPVFVEGRHRTAARARGRRVRDGSGLDNRTGCHDFAHGRHRLAAAFVDRPEQRCSAMFVPAQRIPRNVCMMNNLRRTTGGHSLRIQTEQPCASSSMLAPAQRMPRNVCMMNNLRRTTGGHSLRIRTEQPCESSSMLAPAQRMPRNVCMMNNLRRSTGGHSL